MANITPVAAATTGATYAAPAAATGGGDTIVLGTVAVGSVIFLVANGDVASKTVTLTGTVTCSQGSTHNQAVVVGAGVTMAILINPACVNATTGNVAVTYSAVTSVTVSALHV